MSKYINEELFEKFKILPKDVQDAILSIDTSEIIRAIGEKNNLMIDKIGDMADETGLVMLGLTHPSEFVSHLAERLEMEKEKAKEIAEEINSKVFFPIRENLKKIHGIAPAETSGPIPPIPASPASPNRGEPAGGQDKYRETPAPQPEVSELPVPPPPVMPEPAPVISEPPVIAEPIPPPIEASEIAPPPAPTPPAGNSETKKVDPYREPVT